MNKVTKETKKMVNHKRLLPDDLAEINNILESIDSTLAKETEVETANVQKEVSSENKNEEECKKEKAKTSLAGDFDYKRERNLNIVFDTINRVNERGTSRITPPKVYEVSKELDKEKDTSTLGTADKNNSIVEDVVINQPLREQASSNTESFSFKEDSKQENTSFLNADQTLNVLSRNEGLRLQKSEEDSSIRELPVISYLEKASFLVNDILYQEKLNQSRISRLETELKHSRSEHGLLKKGYDSLKATNELIKRELENTYTGIEYNESKISTLEKTQNNFKEKISSFENEISILTREHETILTENKALSIKNSELESSKKESAEKILSIKNAFQILSNDYNKFRRCAQEVSTEISVNYKLSCERQNKKVSALSQLFLYSQEQIQRRLDSAVQSSESIVRLLCTKEVTETKRHFIRILTSLYARTLGYLEHTINANTNLKGRIDCLFVLLSETAKTLEARAEDNRLLNQYLKTMKIENAISMSEKNVEIEKIRAELDKERLRSQEQAKIIQRLRQSTEDDTECLYRPTPTVKKQTPRSSSHKKPRKENKKYKELDIESDVWSVFDS